MKLELLRIRECTGDKICTPDEIAALFTDEAMCDRECLWVVHLNVRNKVIDKELVAMGTLDASVISPREIFRKAVMNSSRSIALVHNHPGGSLTPSPDDLNAMLRLIKCGEILGIELIDFIIIAGNDGEFWSGNTMYPDMFNL